MVDIDDTLIDGNERVAHGFEFMKRLYEGASLLYPVHVVTARPDSDHASCMRMLRERGFSIPPDRLHMLPAHLYDGPSRHVEEFKWKCYCRMKAQHGGVVARCGDRLWDVAALSSLTTYLSHVRDEDTYVFWDPVLCGCLSVKLCGQR